MQPRFHHMTVLLYNLKRIQATRYRLEKPITPKITLFADFILNTQSNNQKIQKPAKYRPKR